MSVNNRANIVLAISVAGLVVTFPFSSDGFLFALLHHGFIAAVIGGLTDWFAVRAFFSRPLGIKWRTDVLRKNRQRIMQSLVDFVGKDLLSPENIMQLLRQQNLAAWLADYITSSGGREKIDAVAETLLRKTVQSLAPRELAEKLKPFAEEILCSMQPGEEIDRLLQRLDRKAVATGAGRVVFELAAEALKDDCLRSILRHYVSQWRREYEAGGKGRSKLFDMFGLTDDKLTRLLIDRLDGRLREYAAPGSRQNQLVQEFLTEKTAVLLADRRLADHLRLLVAEGWEQLKQGMAFDEWLVSVINNEANIVTWLKGLKDGVDALIDGFVRDAEQQRAVDEWLKTAIGEELTAHHDWLLELIAARLAELSDDKLIEFIETRVADDLQMIRINGAIIGALAGMLLFTLAAVLEGMCGT